MQTAVEFLKALWGDTPPGVILIWTLPAKESKWYTQYDTIPRDLRELEGSDVYTGVGIAGRNGGRFTTQNKLTEDEVGGLAGMWADIDRSHPVHQKPNLPPSLEAVLETLEEARFEPTVLVNSGHGVQAWWLFEQPWMFLNMEDHERGRRAAQWWHQHIKGLFTARGWTTDSVFNLDRIMRLPWTVNNREAGVPKPVTIIGEIGRRYTPQEFHDLVPEDFRTSSPPPGRRGRGSQGGRKRNWEGTNGGASGLVLSPEAEPPLLKLEALLKANVKFRKSWEQDRRDMPDQSPSAYDMSLATMALQAGWDDQEVADLMVCWRRKHGHDLKLRENYYAMTITKAREPIEMAQAQEELNETLIQQPDDQREALTHNLTTLFNVDIDRISKYLGDPPIFHMSTRQGDITIGPVANIISQEKFIGAVVAATSILIPRVARRVWDQRVQAILLAAEEVEVGDASHPSWETHAWLEEYLLDRPPRDEEDWHLAAENKKPFMQRGRTHIFAEDFRRWLELSSGLRITPHQLGQRLRQCGAQTRAVNVRVGSARTKRTTWQLMPDTHPHRGRNGHHPEEEPELEALS